MASSRGICMFLLIGISCLVVFLVLVYGVVFTGAKSEKDFNEALEKSEKKNKDPKK